MEAIPFTQTTVVIEGDQNELLKLKDDIQNMAHPFSIVPSFTCIVILLSTYNLLVDRGIIPCMSKSQTDSLLLLNNLL
jgi:hypothetical protein